MKNALARTHPDEGNGTHQKKKERSAMTHLSETPTTGITRLVDTARDVAQRLGDWQNHQHLAVHLSVDQAGTPAVFFTLASDAPKQDRMDFIDAFADAMSTPVVAYPKPLGGWLMAVQICPHDLPMVVSASVSVGGA